MNQSIITDPRPLEAFKEKTYSGYKKNEIIKALIKSIETAKIENALYWLTECICSGYILEILDKLCIFSSKIIHINNPKLPEFLWRRYRTLYNSINHIPKKEKHKYIHLRNTQSIRHNLFDIVVTLCISSKSKRYDKYPKINISTDFQYNTLTQKMNATMQLLPSHIIRFTDPEELRIIMNELYFNLKNKLGGYDKACYWISWLIQWEKRNKSKKENFEIEERNIDKVKQNYWKDMIWLVWEVIFLECQNRDLQLLSQIQSLYQLFRYDYTSGKRNSRLPYLYHSIGYLTLPLQWKISLKNKPELCIQTQCSVNKCFEKLKLNQVKEYIEHPKPPKKQSSLEKEIIQSRLHDLENIFPST